MTATSQAEFVPDTDELLYERRGAVAMLTFNRPQARNALTWAMYEGLYAACDRHLASALRVLTPQWAIGIGGFAEKRIRSVLEGDLLDSVLARGIRAGCILHPSPASPLANRGWAEAAEKQLAALGVPGLA